MKVGIFLKFVLLFVILAVALGAVGLYSYKRYRTSHYEGVASAELATGVLGSADILDRALALGKGEAAQALSIYSMFPFVLCVEMTSGIGDSLRWPPLPFPCDIIKGDKYHLDYENILSHGGGLRIFVSRDWINEQVDREVDVGFVALVIFLLLFVAGSGFLFHKIVGYPIKYLIQSLNNVSQDLTKQEHIEKLTKDEVGDLTDTLNGMLARIRDYQAELTRLANTDGLTGIYNRRTFFSKGEELRKKYKKGIYFVLIDLDHFKSINDTHGHAAGDTVLESVGQLLSGALRTSGTRTSDIVGRLGGEEFGILMFTDSIQSAVAVAERLRESLESTPIKAESEYLTVTGSFGLAELVAGEDLDELYRRADQACYLAKEGGRNQVCYDS